MKHSFIILLAAVGILASPAFAQQNASGAELVYVDGGELTVAYADGTLYDYAKGGVTEGDIIPQGATIKTGSKTLAELRLRPNKSIIKLAKNTNFKVEGLSTAAGGTNSFSLLMGKVRIVAAKITGADQFKIKGQTAVCGVRGTDFTFAAEPGSADRLVVKQGLVDMWRYSGQAEDLSSKVAVASGQYADAISQGALSAFAAGQDVLDAAYSDMNFQRAKETEVPGHEVALESPGPSSPSSSASPNADLALAPSATPSPEASPAIALAPSPAAGQSTPKATPKPKTPAPTVASDSGEAPSTDSAAPGSEKSVVTAPAGKKSNPVLDWLSQFMNAEIGSISIDNKTYAKAVLQPVIQIGKMRAALYLPIIYQQNLFDPTDWYHPQGNDEWSWGTEYFKRSDTLGGIIDAAKDLALKIKSFEYGDQQFDPFFIKVGNLSDFTLGHGMLMKDYSNDAEFPVIRRVGVDIGFNTANSAPFGMEVLTNDLSDPEIFGARFLLRPAKSSSFALGLSSVIDTAPASMLDSSANENVSDSFGDIALSGVGLDADMPLMNTQLFTLKAFADAGAIVPYVSKEYTLGGTTVEPGLKYSMIWNSSQSKAQNWGAMAGLLGSVASVFDWRLDYRYSTGSFSHNFFDKNYDANRGKIAAEYASILADPNLASSQPDIMGIYGEGGFSVLQNKLVMTVGYFWPWAAEYGFDVQKQMGVLSKDKLHAQIDLKKGLIPNLDIAGSVSYDRTGFASALASDASSGDIWVMLFDENTSFRGELVLPIPKAPMLDLAMALGTAPERDAQGNVVFVDAAGIRPKMVPVFSLETRLHF